MSKQKSNNGTVFEISADLEFSVVVTIRIPIAFPLCREVLLQRILRVRGQKLGPVPRSSRQGIRMRLEKNLGDHYDLSLGGTIPLINIFKAWLLL